MMGGILRYGLAGAALGAIACSASACGAPGFASAPLVQVPQITGAESRCQVAASHENPLVTEWSASDKANLEAHLSDGSIVVAYSGCTLKVLPSCRVPGAYRWRRTTTATDVVEIHNADDLYAKLPLGAVSLEGELQRTGRLAVQTTVSGQYQLADFDAQSVPRGPECLGATHVLGALSVGAFKLHSGGTGHLDGKASVAKIGSAGGSSESDQSLVREAGTPERCEQADDSHPHPECASPIQMFLQPLPTSVVDRGPQGTLKVRFLPVRSGQKWDVSVGDRSICTTPCEKWLDPAMPYTLKYDPGFWQRTQTIEVPDLRTHASSERVEVRVRPTRDAELLGGIVATTFGGIATLTGIALAGAGCGGGDQAMCNAGLITLPAGLLGVAPGIWMIVDSGAEVRVSPMGQGTASAASSAAE
jgi:hypothetical protein